MTKQLTVEQLRFAVDRITPPGGAKTEGLRTLEMFVYVLEKEFGNE